MLDRLQAGLVSLPTGIYDLILLLSSPISNDRSESLDLLDRDALTACVRALRPGGELQSQDCGYASAPGAERTEAILAGLIVDTGGSMLKPQEDSSVSVPLKLGRKAAQAEVKHKIEDAMVNGDILGNGNGAAKRKSGELDGITGARVGSKPAGVGFVDFDSSRGKAIISGEDLDDFADDDDDDLIDEDAFLTEEDKQRPVMPRKLNPFQLSSLPLVSLLHPIHTSPTSNSSIRQKLTPHSSTRMPTRAWQKTPPRLQRLHLWPRRQTRRRRHVEALCC